MYEEETKQKVLDFIKKKKRTYYKELRKLGTDKNKFDSYAFKEILEDLEKEGKIQVEMMGNMKIISIKW